MAVGLKAAQAEDLLAVPGVRLAACHSGIKPGSNRNDLVLIELEQGASVAGVFTRNRFCAAPVSVAKRHLAGTEATRCLLINSGNANAGTGRQGEEAALSSCRFVADNLALSPGAVLPFSTGVIGQQLPVERIRDAMPELVKGLVADNWLLAARGIMTTDTLPKACSRRIEIDGRAVTITGISKGSGMIRPDMATMLAYVATDALIDEQQLASCLKLAVEGSFNAITVDGDTSTNDSCVLMATGKSGVKADAGNQPFMQALQEVFQWLAQAIVRDGEGATKFVEIQVVGAKTPQDARAMAYTIAHSPLVKTALFASDANWGRILAAAGRAPVASLDIDRLNLFLGDVRLVSNGLPDAGYSEARGQAEMAREEIVIRVELGLGEEAATVWTSDLSYDYVKINAEYRS